MASEVSGPPSACAVLSAEFRSQGASLAPQDETRRDTQRIQGAIDQCGRGQTVELRRAGAQDAFLAGPLQLRSEVTLQIDEGVVLFASREARDYQVKQGSCGVVDDRGNGCRPLLSCDGTQNAGLSGAGAIDGRGELAILGETFSWWDLAGEARLNRGKVNAPRLLRVQGCQGFRRSSVQLRNSPADPNEH